MLPGFVCFFVGLLYELEMGIFTGVGTHLIIVLYNSARPRVRVDIKQVMKEKTRILVFLRVSNVQSAEKCDNFWLLTAN